MSETATYEPFTDEELLRFAAIHRKASIGALPANVHAVQQKTALALEELVARRAFFPPAAERMNDGNQ